MERWGKSLSMAKRRTIQQEFEGLGFKKPNAEFGGSLLKGNPKTKRPLDSKLPIHLVLRARRSNLRLPKTFGLVHDTLMQIAQKHGVIIYRYANVGNHLHIVLRLASVRGWAAFIRELTRPRGRKASRDAPA